MSAKWPEWRWDALLDAILIQHAKKSPATEASEPAAPLYARGRNWSISNG